MTTFSYMDNVIYLDLLWASGFITWIGYCTAIGGSSGYRHNYIKPNYIYQK